MLRMILEGHTLYATVPSQSMARWARVTAHNWPETESRRTEGVLVKRFNRLGRPSGREHSHQKGMSSSVISEPVGCARLVFERRFKICWLLNSQSLPLSLTDHNLTGSPF